MPVEIFSGKILFKRVIQYFSANNQTSILLMNFMINVYSWRKSNIYKTYLLIITFIVLIALLGKFFSWYFHNYWFFYFSLIFALLSVLVNYWYSDKIILWRVGGKLIEKKDNPEIYRLVENLAITAGLPTPKIYLINESAPNAFATGRAPKCSAVAVTKGLLEKLNKSELEGVIAHELSHIKNRDTLLMTLVAALVGIVAVLSDWYWRISFWWGGDDDNRGNILFFLVGILASVIAYVAAILIQLAISRRREFLADASAVLLTRYPEGLISALEKISQDPTQMRKVPSGAAHLFIANPFKKKSFLISLFSTHPPIKERIAKLREME